MTKSKLILLIGCIASGKSTYCHKVAKTAAGGSLILNDDAIVNMLHGNNYDLYDKKLKPLYKSIENHIVALAAAFGRCVVVDRGLNISQKSRQRFLALASSLDMSCEAIVFPHFSAATHARRRFQADARGMSLAYWLKAAERHEQDYQYPDLAEGFSSIRVLTREEIVQM